MPKFKPLTICTINETFRRMKEFKPNFLYYKANIFINKVLLSLRKIKS